jgi:hypothetical protein
MFHKERKWDRSQVLRTEWQINWPSLKNPDINVTE